MCKFSDGGVIREGGDDGLCRSVLQLCKLRGCVFGNLLTDFNYYHHAVSQLVGVCSGLTSSLFVINFSIRSVLANGSFRVVYNI